jgi:phage N-6-adenine-methyltransferase
MTQTNVNIVNPKHIAYVGSLRQSGDESGDAWFTPAHTINLARHILNGIDLDPFSSDDANLLVKANKYFTREKSAFANDWIARSVFMNPPYSRGLCAEAVEKFLHEFKVKHFSAGIVLVNNMTDTRWFHDLAVIAIRRCDFKGRIGFVTADNKRISGNTRGQTFFLFSRNLYAIGKFDKIMPHEGIVYERPKTA